MFLKTVFETLFCLIVLATAEQECSGSADQSVVLLQTQTTLTSDSLVVGCGTGKAAWNQSYLWQDDPAPGETTLFKVHPDVLGVFADDHASGCVDIGCAAMVEPFRQHKPTELAQLFMDRSGGYRVAEFRGATINMHGWILNPATCEAKWNTDWGMETVGQLGFPKPDATPVQHGKVISLANYEGKEVYHFPVEDTVALMNIGPSILADKDVKIHVTEASSYVLQWLDLLGIRGDRVVDGTVLATERLYVPEVAKSTYPSKKQYSWLQRKVWKAIGVPEQQDTLVLVKRTDTRMGRGGAIYRGVRNHDAIMPLVDEFAKAHGLQVWIHDDTNLPSVLEQLGNFSRAAAIIAPHGGAEVFAVATPPGACVVEMLPPGWTHSVFMRQSIFTGQHYYGLPLSRQSDVDMGSFKEAMNECSAVMY